MLIDGRTVPSGTVIETEVCLIGAGPAGIAIARAFDNGPTSVCLLESGGFTGEKDTQALYEGINSGTILREHQPYLSRSRIRVFGGTTIMWWGWCIPMRAIDFEERPWVAHSGWPFSKAVLDPYYARAASVLELKLYGKEFPGTESPPRPLLLENSERIDTHFFHLSPTFVGIRYRDELVNSRNVSLYLHANLIDLRTNANASRVESVAVASLDGNRFTVKARYFVLCTGAIENARLLLLSNSVQKAGLGNDHDLVGRFFCDHPHLDVGHLLVSQPDRNMELYSFCPDRAYARMGFLSIADKTLREHRLRSLRIWLQPEEPQALPNLSRAVGKSIVKMDYPAQDGTVNEMPRQLRGLEPQDGLFFQLNVCCEVTPNPNNRVTLIVTA